MNSKISTYGVIAAKAALSLAFAAAGAAKLTGVEMMVATFEAVGIGQWFRYVTGIIEVGGALLLWVPGAQFIAAAMLVATMAGAVLAHVFILGPSAVPALVLGVISAIVAYNYRDQNPLAGLAG